jgi:hypothetical protein
MGLKNIGFDGVTTNKSSEWQWGHREGTTRNPQEGQTATDGEIPLLHFGQTKRITSRSGIMGKVKSHSSQWWENCTSLSALGHKFGDVF